MDKSLPEGNIVTSVSQYPHIALLGFGDPPYWACTGTLISKQFILTAAHCLHYYEKGNVIAHLGFLDKRNRNESGTLQEYRIIQTYEHPTRKSPTYYADIAILKLDRPVEYTKAVVPACLHEDVNIPTDNIQEIGWRLEYAVDSDLLQVTNQTVSNDEECARAYVVERTFPRGIDAESQFCAKIKGGECVTTFIDNRFGIPLQIHDTSDTPKIVGILSLDILCKDPTLYTKVSYYVRWIESIVWPGASGHSTD